MGRAATMLGPSDPSCLVPTFPAWLFWTWDGDHWTCQLALRLVLRYLDPRNGRFNSHLDETRPWGSSCGHCVMPYIYIYPYISVYLNQIDAHRRSYMDLTAQVRLLTVKLANHYESLAVHSDRSQVGFLMNLAYFMAAAGDGKKTEMGVATCRDHTPLWRLYNVSPKLNFCWFTVRSIHDFCGPRVIMAVIMTVIMGNWRDKQSGVLQEPRSPGWCKGHADQVRWVRPQPLKVSTSHSVSTPDESQTFNPPYWMNGIPNVKLYPRVHNFPFLRLGWDHLSEHMDGNSFEIGWNWKLYL